MSAKKSEMVKASKLRKRIREGGELTDSQAAWLTTYENRSPAKRGPKADVTEAFQRGMEKLAGQKGKHKTVKIDPVPSVPPWQCSSCKGVNAGNLDKCSECNSFSPAMSAKLDEYQRDLERKKKMEADERQRSLDFSPPEADSRDSAPTPPQPDAEGEAIPEPVPPLSEEPPLVEVEEIPESGPPPLGPPPPSPEPSPGFREEPTQHRGNGSIPYDAIPNAVPDIDMTVIADMAANTLCALSNQNRENSLWDPFAEGFWKKIFKPALARQLVKWMPSGTSQEDVDEYVVMVPAAITGGQAARGYWRKKVSRPAASFEAPKQEAPKEPTPDPLVQNGFAVPNDGRMKQVDFAFDEEDQGPQWG